MELEACEYVSWLSLCGCSLATGVLCTRLKCGPGMEFNSSDRYQQGEGK